MSIIDNPPIWDLAVTYAGPSLVEGFNWIDTTDPSHGYVSYQNMSSAQAMGLFSVDENTGVVRLGVEHKNDYPLSGGQGRPSVRLESKAAYNNGLFIADFLHMPPSTCGLWPAFWAYGPDWPHGGEVDIIEGVDTASQNLISAHTADGCTLDSSVNGLYSGTQLKSNCAIGSDNVGCGYTPPASDTSTYGTGFNNVGGGVYAMQWDSEFIKVWHFARSDIPKDITGKKPVPDSWKAPYAVFGGSSCSINNFFKDMSLVININFCGDYGNAVWGKTDSCNKFTSTCNEFVANNPQAFVDAYWDVKYIDAYVATTNTTPPAKPSTTTTTATSTTTLTVGGSPTNKPAPSVTGELPVPSTTNPAKINGFANLGCYISTSGFPTFHEALMAADMSIEKCVDTCKSNSFAGVFNSTCYCADNIDAGSHATTIDSCRIPCPGDNGFCGGLLVNNGTHTNLVRSPTRHFVRRDIATTHLLTVYGLVQGDETPPPIPPPMASGQNVTYTCPDMGKGYPTPTASEKQKGHKAGMSGAAETEWIPCGCEDDKTRFPQPTAPPGSSSSALQPGSSNNNGNSNSNNNGNSNSNANSNSNSYGSSSGGNGTSPPVVVAGTPSIRSPLGLAAVFGAATLALAMLL